MKAEGWVAMSNVLYRYMPAFVGRWRGVKVSAQYVVGPTILTFSSARPLARPRLSLSKTMVPKRGAVRKWHRNTTYCLIQN